MRLSTAQANDLAAFKARNPQAIADTVAVLRGKVDGLQVWQTWLDSLAAQHGEVYRVRAERLRREGLARKENGHGRA